MTDYILYLIAKMFSLFLSALPAGTALAVGRLFGRLAYLINYKRAKVAYSNMRAAFSAEKTPAEIRRIVKRLYMNFGQTLVEVLRIPIVNKAYTDKYVSTCGRGNFDKTHEKGRGIIFLTGHFGNWELLSIKSALEGYPLMVLAREQKMKRMNDALNAMRESKGCKVVKKGMATREIYEHLGKNNIVGILSDQDAGKKAIFVDFFGRPTSTHRGAFALARKTGSAIIPVFLARVNGAYHKLILEEPIEVAGGDEKAEFHAMQRFARIFEKHIRQYPEQWLWLHKRWKSTPLKKVVVLSDGKKGHLNQSLAIYEKITECRRQSGHSDADTELKIIEIRHKTAVHRAALSLLSHITARYALIRMSSLRSFVTGATYAELQKSYADIVISCGSQTAAVNLIFSAENNARSAIAMKPGFSLSSGFDLAVIPEHDNPPQRKNIIRTVGTPNLITEERLNSDLKSLKGIVDLEGKRSIGLFVGGDSKRYTFDQPLIKGILGGIISAADELDANILATTSRRTAPAIDSLVKDSLSGSSRSKLLVVANKENPGWTVGGILAASDVIVVSGESSSMLSEAASSGKHVLVFKPKRKPGAPKNDRHDALLKNLRSKDLIRISEAGNIKSDILELAGLPIPAKKLDDNRKILEGVKRLI
ncbi:MAG: mitochondrial fission ELM1 family protein [Candidatus Omnitrophica bacterium]|nr:mitochondrial fission ELM1 family protein [Candidatus Omnitrophota bacterium]